jgi:hypothetical protein
VRRGTTPTGRRPTDGRHAQARGPGPPDHRVQPFQWTGDEPDALNDEDEALALGAVWEGDELVTYDFSTLALKAGSDEDDFLNDND